MSYFDDYKRRVNILGSSSSERMVNLQRTTIKNSFSNTPSYFEVTINSSSSPVGVQIVDDSNVRDQKLIICVDYQLKNGDVIDWQDAKWINVLTDDMSDIYYRGQLRRCVGQLKWLDSNGLPKERYFTFKSDSSTNFGVQDGRIMTLGNERRILIVPLDDDTKLIGKDRRFIFDSRAWISTTIDTISVDNLLIMTVEESEIDKTNDNLDLGIADYYNNLPPEPNPDPAPVGYSVVIDGSESIKKNLSQIYIATVYADAIIDATKIVTWELLNDDESGGTSLATIVSQSGTQCEVKAASTIGQYVKLKATMTTDSSITSIKRIQIKGLY